jgi:hypothetical protein
MKLVYEEYVYSSDYHPGLPSKNPLSGTFKMLIIPYFCWPNSSGRLSGVLDKNIPP